METQVKGIRILFFVLIWSGLLLSSCQAIDPNVSTQAQPVLEAYLAAGHIVSMKVSTQIWFETGDTSAVILGLSPVLSVDDMSFTMVESGDSTYQLTSEYVKAGSTYSVLFEYGGETITSTTIIPDPAKNYALSDTVMIIEPFTSGSFPGSIPTFPDPITATWDNSEQNYYLVVVKNIEEDPVAINSSNSTQVFSFRSNPMQGNSYPINARQFQYYGKHWVILYRINAEYAAMYQNNGSSSLTIKTPYSNVTNGLGIFTGINADTIVVNIKKE